MQSCGLKGRRTSLSLTLTEFWVIASPDPDVSGRSPGGQGSGWRSTGLSLTLDPSPRGRGSTGCASYSKSLTRSAATSVVGIDEEFFVPGVADAAGIGSGVNARTPIGFGSPATGGNIEELAVGEGSRFLDANDVVFETEITVDVGLVLVMAATNDAPVGEGQFLI